MIAESALVLSVCSLPLAWQWALDRRGRDLASVWTFDARWSLRLAGWRALPLRRALMVLYRLLPSCPVLTRPVKPRRRYRVTVAPRGAAPSTALRILP